MSIPFSNTNYRIPRGFANLLEGFTREVLREQPKDIPLFGAKYFQGLLKQRAETNFDPAEWGASLEDRFYNNHAFQNAELNAYTLEGLENGTQNGVSLPENSHITEPTNHSADKAQKEVERSGELGQINAATVIQAAFRGHITRQEVHRLKRSTDENSLKSTSCDSKPEAVLQKTDIYQEKHMESDAAALPNHGGEQTTTDIESGGSTGGGLERVLDTEIKGETTETATENDEELHGVHTSAGEGDAEPKDLHTLETGDPALEEEGETLNSETSNFQAEELPVSSEAHSHSFIREQNHVAETITEQSQVITADDAAEHIPDDSTMETNTSPVTNASESPNDETDSDKAEISAEKRDFQPPELRLSLKENPHFCRLSPHLSGMDCCHNENFRKPLEEALDIALDDPDANAAAAKIQAGFRGHMTRKKMKSGEKDLKKDGKERSSSQGEGD